ncbi:hypothetical protein KBC40_01955 [Patescibacteria group bacterium]|nr:hypothetical protein [Patescibacteria group bacterium]
MSTKMTDDQINLLGNLFREELRECRGDFDQKHVRLAIGHHRLGPELLSVFSNRVQLISDMIVRHVKVDRARSYQALLDATGRKQHVRDKSLLETIPPGHGEEVDVFFFPTRRSLNEDEVRKELDFFKLRPDFAAQAQVNIDDPAFADEYPNGYRWRTVDGKRCFAAYSCSGERYVSIDSIVDDGGKDFWWYGGVPK